MIVGVGYVEVEVDGHEYAMRTLQHVWQIPRASCARHTCQLMIVAVGRPFDDLVSVTHRTVQSVIRNHEYTVAIRPYH